MEEDWLELDLRERLQLDMWRGLGGNWGKSVSAMRDFCVEGWALNSVMKHPCWWQTVCWVGMMVEWTVGKDSDIGRALKM